MVADGGKNVLSLRGRFDQVGGLCVLAIRPLLWKNGWPVAGEAFKEGTTRLNPNAEVMLELAVDFVRMQGSMHRFGRKMPAYDTTEITKRWKM